MSAHNQAGGTIAPQSCKSGMVASAPYSSAHDDIRGNRGCYEGCVVVSRQFTGSDYAARTERHTQVDWCAHTQNQSFRLGLQSSF